MRTISKSEYDALVAASDVIEKDRRGEKVLRLSTGHFLKTFWFRYKISSRRIYPEWLRFSLHAKSLQKRNIPTVTMIESVKIPHLNRTGVIYEPLEGRTLRQVSSDGEFSEELAVRLGAFVAGLHNQGIHFHSLHLGNVLLCPDQTFGLLDISDMRVYRWPLCGATRIRNFIHLFRYEQDCNILKSAGKTSFFDGYNSVHRLKRLSANQLMPFEKWMSS